MRARDKLKAWRERNGLSQTQAAERVGVGQPAWSAWESGAKRPGIEQVIALSGLTQGSDFHIVASDWVESQADRAERQAHKRTRRRRATREGAADA